MNGLNRVYRLVWSAVQGRLVVCGELTKKSGKQGRGVLVRTGPCATSTVSTRLAQRMRSAFLASMLALLPEAVQAEIAGDALPQGGSVASGSATIQSSGSQMEIIQSTDKAIINWSQFNVGADASVNFVQPASSSVVLNRVTSVSPSTINGQLTANGQVFLVNPHGVYFGNNARVDVGALVASTLDITNQDFLAGNYNFNGGGFGGITNKGSLTGGFVALIAPDIENEGSILARVDSVALASGDQTTLTFADNRLISISVDEAQLESEISNTGSITAENGSVILKASAAQRLVDELITLPEAERDGQLVTVNGVPQIISSSGLITADNVEMDAGDTGAASVSGRVDVSSSTGSAGKIQITGEEVSIQAGAELDATGATGGGEILVGGDWQGSGDVRQATYATVEAGATLNASATERGDGGKIVVWSDVHDPDAVTHVHGDLLAQGGMYGGDGGSIETSGAYLEIDGITASVASSYGEGGLWLIDPVNITIDSTLASSIATALGSGNVTISTDGSNTPDTSSGESGSDGWIKVNSAISWSANKLTLQAATDIYIYENLNGSGTAQLALEYGQGAVASGNSSDYYIKDSYAVSLPDGSNFSTKLGSDGSTNTYTVISTLGTEGATTSKTTLQGIAAASWGADAYIAIGGNIDASATTGWTSDTYNHGFTPIDDVEIRELAGLGHTIDQLYVMRKGNNYSGLFGNAHRSGAGGGLTVRDLGITNANISGLRYVGALAGAFSDGNGALVHVKNVYATGSVAAGNFNNASPYTLGATADVGGLIGRFNSSYSSTVEKSYSTASVTAHNGGYVGGLIGGVGQATNGLTVSQSFATGNVDANGLVSGGTAANQVGGLVGYLGGGTTVINSYATGSVTGYGSVGGLVGQTANNQYYPITLEKTYASGAVTATQNSGGIVGYTPTSHLTLTDNYWDTQTTGKSAAIGRDTTNSTDDTTPSGSTGLTTAQATDQSSFTNWDFSDIWATKSSVNSDYAILRGNLPAGVTLTTAITLTLGDLSRTYGDSNTSLTGLWSVSGCSGCLSSVDWGSAVGTSSSVGSYSYSTANVLSLSYASGSASDYDVSYSSNSLTINTRAITVTAADQSRVYGDSNPTTGSVTLTSGSLVGSDALSTATVSSSATTTTSVGSSSLTPSSQTFSSGSSSNYNITYANGTLSITTRPITVTADNQSRGYGADNPTSGSVTLSSGSLVGSDALSTATVSSSAASSSTVGSSFSLTPSNQTFSSGSSSNYNITYADGSLSISKGTLTITASNQSKIYGNTLNLGTSSFTTSGLANGETVGSVTLASLGNYDASTTASANTYSGDIRPSGATGGTFSSSNYNISYVDGDLVISKATPVIQFAGNLDKVDGDSSFTQTASVTSGPSSVTYSSSNTGVATVDASTGTVTIVAPGQVTISASSASDNNYQSGSGSYTLTVLEAATTAASDQIPNESPAASQVNADGSRAGSIKSGKQSFDADKEADQETSKKGNVTGGDQAAFNSNSTLGGLEAGTVVIAEPSFENVVPAGNEQPSPTLNSRQSGDSAADQPIQIAAAETPSVSTANNGSKEAGAGGSDENNNTISGVLGNQGNDKDVGNAGGDRGTKGTKVSQDEGGKQEPTEEPTQIAKTEQPEKLNDNTPNENNGKRPTKERTDLEDEGGSITKEEEPTRIARVEEPSEPTTNNGAQEAGAGGSDENDSTLSGMLDNQQPTEKLVQAAKLGLPDKRSDDVLNNGSRTDNGDEGGKTKEKAIQFGRVEAALRSVSKSDLPSGSIDEVGGSKGRQLILSKAKIEYGETDIPLTSIDDGGAGVDDVIQTKEPPLFKSKRGTRFVYQIPEDTFIHSDPNAELTIDAKMKDGSPLESWMSFDQGKMQISGEIPMNHSSNIEVEVLAYDQSGDEAMVEVMIEVK